MPLERVDNHKVGSHQDGYNHNIQDALKDASQDRNRVFSDRIQVREQHLAGCINLCLGDTKRLDCVYQRDLLVFATWGKQEPQLKRLLNSSVDDEIEKNGKPGQDDQVDDNHRQ